MYDLLVGTTFLRVTKMSIHQEKLKYGQTFAVLWNNFSFSKRIGKFRKSNRDVDKFTYKTECCLKLSLIDSIWDGF